MSKFVYITKSVNKNLTANHNGVFQYPEAGIVEAPDWDGKNDCGGGLHGFLWGEGDGDLADFSSEAIWLLIKVNPEDGLVIMDDKCKFRRGEVVLVSDYKTVALELQKHLPLDRMYKVIGSTVTGGYASTVTGGNRSTVTGGDASTVTGGDASTVIIIYWDDEREK